MEVVPIIITICFVVSAIDKAFMRKYNSQNRPDASSEKSHWKQEQLHPLVQEQNSFTPAGNQRQSKGVCVKCSAISLIMHHLCKRDTWQEEGLEEI